MANPEINLTPTATILAIDPFSLTARQVQNKSVANERWVKSDNEILCRAWGIASQSNVGILLIHGLGAHSGWFEAFARRLQVRQIFVLSFDLIGFGQRQNDNYDSYRHWLKDIAIVFAYLKSIMAERPVFLLGNSMGALLALESCQSTENGSKPSGLILFSPAFSGHPKIFNLSYQVPKFLKALTNPKQEIVLPYGSDLITSSEQARIWLDSDVQHRMAVPGKMLLDLLFLMCGLRWKKINIPYPLLMVMAAQDSLVDNRVCELIFQQIICENKKKTVLAGAMHDLTLDLAIDQVVDLLVDWVNSFNKMNSSK